MRKIILVALSVFLFFLIEFFLFNMGGRWLMPNLLLLVVIYFNLAFGIRYSIFAAVLAGIFKDSFGAGIFGIHIFSFVLCAYMTTILKRYLHYVASRRSRLLLVLGVTIIHIAGYFCLQLIVGKVNMTQVLTFVAAPEILTTLLVTSFTFAQLRKCVLKFRQH